MDLKIAHFDIPNYYAVLEELRDSGLKNRPLVLAEPRPRALVQGVNGIALREGLKEGMPLSRARRLCRRRHIVPPDHGFYRKRHRQVLDFFGRFSPLVEGILPGRYFVDVAGTRRLWGAATDATYRMEKELSQRERLPARAGLGNNKLVSQVAAKVIPPGDLGCVFPGGEASFLAPLPVDFLPGVGLKTSSLLEDFNIRRIGELADLPEESLSMVFGNKGFRLIQLARGIDSTPVLPLRKKPGVSVNRILDRDEIDRFRLEAFLFQQVEEAAWMLRRHNRYAKVFSLEIRYADGVSVQRRRSLPVPTANLDRRLFQTALEIFSQLFNRRVAVRRLTLELSSLSMPSRQLSLFPVEDKDDRLQRAIDRVRRRFGREAVSWGRTVTARTVPLPFPDMLEAPLAV